MGAKNPGIALEAASYINVFKTRDARAIAERFWKGDERFLHMAGVRVDEPFVIVPVFDIGDLHVRLAGPDRLGSRVEDVLLVLRTARIRPLRRADEADGALHAGVGHLLERVGQQRMPVAHPDEHRQVEACRREPRPQTLGLLHRDFGQGRHAPEVLVVADDLFDALGWNAASPEDVGEKRPDVGWPKRATEGNHKDGVERAACAHETDQW